MLRAEKNALIVTKFSGSHTLVSSQISWVSWDSTKKNLSHSVIQVSEDSGEGDCREISGNKIAEKIPTRSFPCMRKAFSMLQAACQVRCEEGLGTRQEDTPSVPSDTKASLLGIRILWNYHYSFRDQATALWEGRFHACWGDGLSWGWAVRDQGQVAWGVRGTWLGRVLRNLATAPTNACVELYSGAIALERAGEISPGSSVGGRRAIHRRGITGLFISK